MHKTPKDINNFNHNWRRKNMSAPQCMLFDKVCACISWAIQKASIEDWLWQKMLQTDFRISLKNFLTTSFSFSPSFLLFCLSACWSVVLSVGHSFVRPSVSLSVYVCKISIAIEVKRCNLLRRYSVVMYGRRSLLRIHI